MENFENQIVLSGALKNNTNDINKLFSTVETDDQAVCQLQLLKELSIFLRETKKKVEEDIIDYMSENKVKELIVSDSIKIVKTVKKTNRFETEFIYKALDFTEEQQAVLPKNPSFRKTAILCNDKTAIAHSEDVTEIPILKELDKKFIN